MREAKYIQLSVWGDAQREILVAGAIFLAVLILAAFLVRWLQRKVDPRRRKEAEQDGKFTIEQIESIHQAGQISDEEFATMRRVVMKLDSTAEKNSDSSCRGGKIVDSGKGELSPDNNPTAEKDSE